MFLLFQMPWINKHFTHWIYCFQQFYDYADIIRILFVSIDCKGNPIEPVSLFAKHSLNRFGVYSEICKSNIALAVFFLLTPTVRHMELDGDDAFKKSILFRAINGEGWAESKYSWNSMCNIIRATYLAGFRFT